MGRRRNGLKFLLALRTDMVFILDHEELEFGEALWGEELGENRAGAIDFLKVKESNLDKGKQEAYGSADIRSFKVEGSAEHLVGDDRQDSRH